MKRPFQGGRSATQLPGLLPGKIPGSEGDNRQKSESAPAKNTKSLSTPSSLKATREVSTLSSSGSKTSGQPPAIHTPWNKARIGPMENEHRGKERSDEKREEKSKRERAEARKRENKKGGSGDGTEKDGRGKMELWARSNKSGLANNGMRNVGGEEGFRPDHMGELPGLSSSDQFFTVNGGVVIDGSYFQTPVDASKPPAVKQKPSEALSLISFARRLQGPARVGDTRWSNGKSRDRGEENSREIYGTIGERSVSASVSERDTGEEKRRWELEHRSSEGWWRRKQFQDYDSETGSGSRQSQSDASSITSSVRGEHESETETEKNESESGSEREGGSSDRGRESESGSQDEAGEGFESGLESEDEGSERSTTRSKVSNGSESIKRRSSRANRRRGGSGRSTRRSSDSTSSRYSGSTISGSRPRTSRHSRSSHETIEEESEEEDESEVEEVESAGSPKSSSSRRSSTQSDVSSGVTDTSEYLSPIIEDAEEEEEEKGGGQGREEDKEDEGDLENASTA